MKVPVTCRLSLFVALATLAANASAATNEAATAAQVAARSLESSVLVLLRPKMDEGVRSMTAGGQISRNLRRESSFEQRGFLVDAETVWCKDFGLAPENVDSITVLHGGVRVPAELAGRARDREAAKLRLLAPLEGVEPFGPCSTNPAAWRSEPQTMIDGRAVTRAQPIDAENDCRLWDDGRRTFNFWNTALFDAEGAFAGLCYGETDAAGPFDPAGWALLGPDELAAAARGAAEAHRASIVPVTLTFRSPKEGSGGDRDGGFRRVYHSSSSSSARVDESTARSMTELKTVGRVLAGGRVLVDLLGARAAVPRLDRIDVFSPDGAAHAASFAFVHRRADLLAADLAPADAAAFEPLPVHEGSVRDFETRLGTLLRAEPAGAGRISLRAEVVRQGSFSSGWRDHVRLWTPADEDLSGDTYFSLGGEAVWVSVVPVFVEESIGEDDSWRSTNGEALAIPASDFLAFADPAPADRSPIRPAAAEDENATGWIGLDLQPLDRELAEAMDAMEATEGGNFGAVVSKVHAGSAAAEAGVEDGWILLSIRPAGAAAPQRVSLEDRGSSGFSFGGGFPWDSLDDIPPQYLDRFDPPWPRVASRFTDALWALGEGTAIEAEFLVGGEKKTRTLSVGRAPAHFATAPVFKWKAGGMTVCDLTFEVREYLNLAEDAPGVVVCRVETDSRPATAGLRRYEVVRSVNGAPVADAAAFGAAVALGNDFAFEVLRHADTRVVRFSLPAPESTSP